MMEMHVLRVRRYVARLSTENRVMAIIFTLTLGLGFFYRTLTALTLKEPDLFFASAALAAVCLVSGGTFISDWIDGRQTDE